MRPRLLTVLLGVAGMVTLGSEIAAARLLAPYFGASTIVWANSIAVVLCGLALGAWAGGRIAERRPDVRSLSLVTLGAAAALACVPFAADPLLGYGVDALDEASIGSGAGSLLAVLLLLGVPVVLLGAVAPWVLRLRVVEVAGTGALSGRLSAISTGGSLLGTFLSALVLIPAVGTQRTFILLALALAAVAVLGTGHRLAIVVPLGIAVLLAVPVGQLKPAADGGSRVVFEAETEMQYVRVLENEQGRRRMELNEGQAVHSVWEPGTVLTGGVWDGLLGDAFSVLDAPPRDVALLGVAGGSVARAYGAFFPATRVDAVELDGELLQIGRRYFGLTERPGLRLIEADARPFLRRTSRRYDVIVLDAYRQPYIPFYLTTREFFRLARSRLKPGGAVVVNVGHPPCDVRLERALSAAAATAFAHLARDPIDDESTVLVASDVRPDAARLRRTSKVVPAELGDVLDAAAGRLRPSRARQRPYTDDRAPVEWLIDTSIVSFAAGSGSC